MVKVLPVIAEIKGLGKIVEVYGEFHTNLRDLKEGGARLISPRDEAYARLQTRGKENIGQNFGTRTTSGFEYLKEQLPILRLNSRLMNPLLAVRAAKANRAGNYFYVDSNNYKESLSLATKDKNKDPIKRNVIILPSRDSFTMSPEENWETFESILKDQAIPYFEFNGSINVYPIDKEIVDTRNGTILSGLWFRSIGGRSGFYGYCGKNLDKVNRTVRGLFPF
jgi:hypothetical protein